MSHLLKKNKFSLKIFRLLFITIIATSIFLGAIFYEGNKLVFILYGLVINSIFLVILRKKVLSFEFFFGILIWLGFWWKFAGIFFLDGFFYEGAGIYPTLPNDIKIIVLDNSLLFSISGFLGFISASCFKNFLYKKDIRSKISLISFSKKKNENLFFGIFVVCFSILVLLINSLNLKFSIYQRGIFSQFEISYLINSIFKWLILFGLTSISTFFFIYAVSKRKFIILVFLSVLETFISNVSLLSRGMIFNSFSVYFGIYKNKNFNRYGLNLRFFLTYFIIIFVLFFISVSTVNYLRANHFFVKVKKEIIKENILSGKKVEENIVQTGKKYNSLPKAVNEFVNLSFNRWVGIDAVVAVRSIENKGYDLLKQAFNDSYSKTKYPFYEREIQKRVLKKSNTIIYGITTPGIIAFFSYADSYIILYMSIFIISLLFIYFEILLIKLTSNVILCSLISQVIAYRLVHFGYLPQNSYLLFISIILSIIVFFMFKYFIKIFAKT